MLRAAYAHPHKVIVDARNGSARYYDLLVDPSERAPRDARESDAGRRLVEAIDRFYAAVASRGRKPATWDHELPAAMEKRLRALGYLD